MTRSLLRAVSTPSSFYRCFFILAFVTALQSASAAELGPALNTAPADNVVVFNEVFYHPTDNDPQHEWIELHNQMYVDVDLSNWSLDGAVQFRFPAGVVIPIGGYVVIAANPGLVSAGNSSVVYGPWTGKLRDSGDLLTLRNHNGRLMDQLSYQDGAPWPVGADGSGASLAKIRRMMPSGPAENWRASAEIGGTPGRINFPGLEGAPPETPVLVAKSAVTHFHIPDVSDAALNWTQLGFDDSAWSVGQGSLGYDLTLPANATPSPIHAFLRGIT